MAFLSLRGVAKAFVPDLPVLQGFDLDVQAGEIVCLLGASGCGKTTLLRVLAGLERADAGDMRLEGREIQGLASHRRRIGFMFQDHVLFPHMNVGDNIAYGLRRQGWSRASIPDRVAELLDLVRMPGYAARGIQELSGGESQRVALARSLAPNPRFLLLDEPLASLDRKLREDLVQEVKDLLQGLSMTALYVTHDQEEAYAIADRIALLHDGCIIRQGPPQDLYQDPGTAYAARFLRMVNLFPCAGPAVDKLPSWLQREFERTGPAAYILIRPDALVTQPWQSSQDAIAVPVQVRDLTFRGRYYELRVNALDSGVRPQTWPMVLDLVAAETSARLLEELTASIAEAEPLSLHLARARMQLLVA